MSDRAVSPGVAFGRPALMGLELEYIVHAVESGRISSGGQFTQASRDLLVAETGAADVLLTTSCTDALEMAAMLLDLGPGDVVVVPSFTFVSTALAFARTGATIRFCDIEPTTLGLDPVHLAELMDDSVRAVVPVHYAGVAADIEGIKAVIEPYDCELVEDNAHGLFGRYRDKPLGSFGRFATLSFHETKNFVCGEGGALIVNRPEDVERAHILLDKGTNRQAFLAGEVDKYTWVDTGSSFGLSEVLAAYLYAQLEQRERILSLRREVFGRYDELLRGVAAQLPITLPVVPDDRVQAYHMYYVLLEDRAVRDDVIARMRDAGIRTAFHYVPLHSSPGAAAVTDRVTACPVTDDISGRLLRLPFHNLLTEQEQRQVVDLLVTAVAASHPEPVSPGQR